MGTWHNAVDKNGRLVKFLDKAARDRFLAESPLNHLATKKDYCRFERAKGKSKRVTEVEFLNEVNLGRKGE